MTAAADTFSQMRAATYAMRARHYLLSGDMFLLFEPRLRRRG